MQRTLSTKRFVVYDDVLTKEEFDELLGYVSDQAVSSVHQQGWKKVWSITDGAPLQSDQVDSVKPQTQAEDETKTKESDASKEYDQKVYPVGDSIDDVISAVNETRHDIAPLIGEQGKDWHNFSARVWLYPLGSGLSWHDDLDVYTGAYIFYTSKEWRPNWGGELLVYCGDVDANLLEPNSDYAENQIKYSRGSSIGNGFGFYVEPRPNRLVILKGGTPHKINHTSPAAGENIRYSIGGFFHKLQQQEQTETEITLTTEFKKLAGTYVARQFDDKCSLRRRKGGYAIAYANYYDAFSYIAKLEDGVITAADLPGDLPPEEKISIVKDLLGNEMLRLAAV